MLCFCWFRQPVEGRDVGRDAGRGLGTPGEHRVGARQVGGFPRQVRTRARLAFRPRREAQGLGVAVPFLAPEGYRDNAKLDPEKLYVATIASSHMLTWLERISSDPT
jgi:hypothetical protein